MRIHEVRQPFLCRVGQFTEGKRELCVGLDYNTLKKINIFWCYLGKNKKTHYEIDTVEALKIGQTWVNAKGKTVIIIPVTQFKVVKSKWDQEKYDEKEAQRAKVISEQTQLI